ncbi:MAG: hypothetical protein FWE31_04170 [Firmicutes bacterium]|nr:hypothetical protein [Bacillota bacterium]
MTTKKEFLETLEKTSNDKELVGYYDELISDRVEGGGEESSVVASLNLRKVLRESEFVSAKNDLTERAQGKRRGRALVVLLALFSVPITLPLAFAFLMTCFAFVITGVALVGGAGAGVVFGIMGIVEAIRIGEAAELILLHSGILLVALVAIAFIGLVLSRVLIKFYRWMVVRFFMAFRRKEAV